MPEMPRLPRKLLNTFRRAPKVGRAPQARHVPRGRPLKAGDRAVPGRREALTQGMRTVEVADRSRLLFRPAIRLMNSLRYSGKFYVIGFLMTVAVGYLWIGQQASTNNEIEFDRGVNAGLEVTEPLVHAIFSLDALRVLSAGLISITAREATERDTMLDDVVESLELVDRELRRNESLLGRPLHQRWRTAVSGWSELRQQRFASVDDSETAYSAFRTQLTDFLVHVSGQTNLIVHSNRAGYWLTDALLLQLPSLSDALAHATVLALGGRKLSDQRVGIALSGSLDVAKRHAHDLESVIIPAAIHGDGRNVTLETALSGPTAQVRQDTIDLTGRIEREYLLPLLERAGTVVMIQQPAVKRGRGRGAKPSLIRSPLPMPAPQASRTSSETAQLFADAAIAFGSMAQLNTLVLAALSEDAHERLFAAEREFRRGGVLVAVIVAIILYLFVGFYISVQDSIAELASATTRMIRGTSEQFKLATKDELANVAIAYNQINSALNDDRSRRQQVQDENDELQDSIVELLKVVSEAADGVLTVRAIVTAGAMGSVADAFNQMMEEWQEVVREIQGQIQSTTLAITNISTSAQGMAEGASRQTLALQETAILVTSMSGSIDAVSQNADSAADASERTVGTAQEGAASVDDVVRGMAQLRTNVQGGAKKVKTLGDRSMEITGIVGTIARISEQTDMLALNASIEAARAGEQGHGFTVVADEVRKLAERTAHATAEIESLVKSIQTEANESVGAIEEQTEEVERQSKLVAEAGEALARIRDASATAAALVQDISGTARLQAKDATTMATAMNDVSTIAQSTESTAQATLGIADELGALAESLGKTVNRFRAD